MSTQIQGKLTYGEIKQQLLDAGFTEEWIQQNYPGASIDMETLKEMYDIMQQQGAGIPQMNYTNLTGFLDNYIQNNSGEQYDQLRTYLSNQGYSDKEVNNIIRKTYGPSTMFDPLPGGVPDPKAGIGLQAIQFLSGTFDKFLGPQGSIRNFAKNQKAFKASKPERTRYEVDIDPNDPNEYIFDPYDAAEGKLSTKSQYENRLNEFSQFEYNPATGQYDAYYSPRPLDEDTPGRTMSQIREGLSDRELQAFEGLNIMPEGSSFDITDGATIYYEPGEDERSQQEIDAATVNILERSNPKTSSDPSTIYFDPVYQKGGGLTDDENKKIFEGLRNQRFFTGSVEPSGNIVSDWWYNLDDVQDMYVMGDKIDRGYTAAWVKHPETRRRVQALHPDWSDAKVDAHLKNALKELETVPVFNDGTLSVADYNYAAGLQGFPKVDSYMDLSNMFNADYNVAGHYIPSKGIIYLAPGSGNNKTTIAHELVHAMEDYQDVRENEFDNIIEREPWASGYLKSVGQHVYDQMRHSDKMEELIEELFPGEYFSSFDYPEYTDLPSNMGSRMADLFPDRYDEEFDYRQYLDRDGMYPRIMEIRRNLNAFPGQIIEQKDLNKIKNSGAYKQLRKKYTNPEILQILNTIAMNDLQQSELPMAQPGIEFLDPNRPISSQTDAYTPPSERDNIAVQDAMNQANAERADIRGNIQRRSRLDKEAQALGFNNYAEYSQAKQQENLFGVTDNTYTTQADNLGMYDNIYLPEITIQSKPEEPGLLGNLFPYGGAEAIPFVGEGIDAIGFADAVKKGNYLDALIYAGAFALPFVGGAGLRQLFRRGRSSIKPNKTFQSEIDWGKWNEEIPLNKELMQEYHTIEEVAKAKGTWMKNPDGSEFTGTPEQFIQQQSKNFTAAFNDWERMYHGSKTNNLENIDLSRSRRQGYGEGFYMTDDLEEAQKYAGLFKTNPPKDGTVYELAVNTENAQRFNFNDKDFLAKWNRSNIQSKKEFLDAYKRKYGEEAPEWYLRNAEEYVGFRENIPDNIDLSKNIILDGGYHNKWILGKDGIKSLKYNNGMFDMTNPNVYKQRGGSLPMAQFGIPYAPFEEGLTYELPEELQPIGPQAFSTPDMGYDQPQITEGKKQFGDRFLNFLQSPTAGLMGDIGSTAVGFARFMNPILRDIEAKRQEEELERFGMADNITPLDFSEFPTKGIQSTRSNLLGPESARYTYLNYGRRGTEINDSREVEVDEETLLQLKKLGAEIEIL